MRNCIWTTLLVSALIGGCYRTGMNAEPSSVSLFNGRNLDGWVIENNGAFSVQ